MKKVYQDRDDIVDGVKLRVYRTAQRDRLSLLKSGRLIGFIRQDQANLIRNKLNGSAYSISVNLPSPYPG